MIKGDMKVIFKDILRQLKASDYNVQVKLMNSKWYNTATSRERLIFIGVRNDLNIKASHPKPKHKPITIEEALKNIRPTEIIYPNNKFIKNILPNVKPGESLSKYHPKGSYFNFRKINPKKPIPTITKTSYKHYFMPNNRVLMPNELQVLQSFPKDYIFEGSYNQQAERIGNSVPPQLMKHIAEHIYEKILQKIPPSSL